MYRYYPSTIAATLLGAGIIAFSASAGSSTAGQTADGVATRTFRMIVPKADVDSPDTARRLFDRIDEAAMEVCGASPFSFPEVRRAGRHSDCWRQSVSTAVAKVHDAGLSAQVEQRLYADHAPIARQD